MSPRHHRELKTWTFKGITQEASLGGGGEKRDKKTGKLHPLEYSILTVKHETLT